MGNGRTDYLTEDKTIKFLDRKLWIRLGFFMKGHRLTISFAFVCLILAEFLPQYQPKLLMLIVDGPIKERNITDLLPYCLYFLLLVLVSSFMRYLAVILSQSAALKIIHMLRLELFRTVQQFRLDFFKRTTVGRLMTRLTSDIDAISTMFSNGFLDLLGAFMMLIFPIVFMFMLNWKLAIISLSTVPVMIFVSSVFRVKVRESNVNITRTIAELNTHFQESLSGNYLIKLFGRVHDQWKQMDNINSSLRDHWFKNVLYYAFYFPIIGGFTEISLMMLYFAGAWYFFHDEVTIGTIVAFSMYMHKFWRPMREISDRITQLQSALASAERVFTLFDVDAKLAVGAQTADFSDGAYLAFKNVDFSYQQDRKVLKNISFRLFNNETLAIVGATGSGKSTLLALCNNFYQPDSGSVQLNNLDLSEFKPGILQKKIAYIPQDVYLFADTVAFNISLSKDYDMDKMERICKYVNAHSFIDNLEDKYQSVLKMRGENLSTGQRQLLAFARALYHDPEILLLDEATSSVDTETELLVQDAMMRITKSTTSIVVAHRLSTIRNADRILVMHKGEIKEQGTHHSLLSEGGIYKKLYQMQSFDLKMK